MADSVFHSVASATNYELSYGDYGSVLVSWAFDVWITLYETPRQSGNRTAIGELRCAFPAGASATAWYRAASLTGRGAGYWNAAGIMWGDGVFTEQWNALRLYPYGSDTDSYGAMLAQLDAATSDYFVRFAFPDDQNPVDLSTWAPQGAWFSRNIYLDELDSDGNLPPLVLARLFMRWYDHDDAEDASSSYPYASRVWLAGEITSTQMNIDWKFYPWARKISDAWLSCNRDYSTDSPNRSAYLRRKESGAWQDVLNTMQPASANDQMAWRKQGGGWKYSPPYGANLR